MPSIASHFACAKIISKELKIEDDDFFRGNILPDVIASDNSHYKVQGSYYCVPDINTFLKEKKDNNSLTIGYLCHLLLDKYFLEIYVPKYIKNYKSIDLFTPKEIYNDYTDLNKLLVDYFKLDLKYINSIMSQFSCKLNIEKYELNIKSINYMETSGKLQHIDLKSYIPFLKEISIRIAMEVKSLIKIRSIV